MAIAITSFFTAAAVGVAWQIGKLEPWFLAMAIVFFFQSLVDSAHDGSPV